MPLTTTSIKPPGREHPRMYNVFRELESKREAMKGAWDNPTSQQSKDKPADLVPLLSHKASKLFLSLSPFASIRDTAIYTKSSER